MRYMSDLLLSKPTTALYNVYLPHIRAGRLIKCCALRNAERRINSHSIMEEKKSDTHETAKAALINKPCRDAYPAWRVKFRAPVFEGKTWRMAFREPSQDFIRTQIPLGLLETMQMHHNSKPSDSFWTKLYFRFVLMKSLRELVDHMLERVDVISRAWGYDMKAEDELKELLESLLLNVIPPEDEGSVYVDVVPEACTVGVYPTLSGQHFRVGIPYRGKDRNRIVWSNHVSVCYDGIIF